MRGENKLYNVSNLSKNINSILIKKKVLECVHILERFIYLSAFVPFSHQHRFLFSFLFSLEIIGSKRAASILFSSDLRAALRLIRRFELLNLISRQNDQFDRICGLMSNHDKLMSCLNEEEEEDGDVLARIRDGAKAMAIARRMGDGLALECSGVRGVCIGRGAAVAYTDLLQPKAMRQSELWFKYCFICSCRQCNAWPPTYVDHTLQEISAVNCNCANLSSDHDFYRYEAIKRLTDFVDDAITEYLTFGNPKSCCDKLGHLLTHGLLGGQFEPKEEKSKKQFWLHLLHQLSLSAYTTLASAYKIRESDLLALDPQKDKLQLEAFERSRTSAAYALLLAGATHHLFVSESSLIASVANFCTSSGRPY